ncbi:MAG TPA: hypothetical protein VFO69_12885 [Allosphingosinicella sp.]|nr:hypothetical protein [Allosphingosinicella sp.]
MVLLILLQAAAQASPDIVLDARARIDEVRIERNGEVSLEVQGGTGSLVEVQKPETRGRTRLRNVDVAVRAEARISELKENPPGAETAQPN